MTGGNTSHYTIADGVKVLGWHHRVRISWFRSNDLWVMGPARFLCAMTRRVPEGSAWRDTPAGNRTRGERMGTVHFTTKPLVSTVCGCHTTPQNVCRNRGSNTGPSDLQSDALPTELFRRNTPTPRVNRDRVCVCVCSKGVSQWRARTADLGFIRPTL